MNLLHSIVLSVVEGITEFLPISSTGHLILTAEILKIQQDEFVKSFEIFIQLGAIFSVVFLYFKDIVKKRDLWKNVGVAFIPTAVVGLVLYKFIKEFLLGNAGVTLLALFIGGVSLILLEIYLSKRQREVEDVSKITLKKAFGIGLIQSISVIPGVSRSAASIMGGMFLGLDRKSATEFSFILAIPTMLAATGLDLVKSSFHFTPQQLVFLGIGFVGSFIVALISIKFLLGYVKDHTFIPFGFYRIILALLYFFIVFKQ